MHIIINILKFNTYNRNFYNVPVISIVLNIFEIIIFNIISYRET